MRRLSHALALLVPLAGPAAADLPAPLDPKDYPTFPEAQVELGRLLFHDPILSGNRNVACATCHSLDHATTDNVSLGIGEGGRGLGPERITEDGPGRIAKRIPRNAPALFDLGHRDVRVLFHDGRLEPSDLYENGFNSPAEEWLPGGLTSILAVQALFPMTAEFEMAGNVGENEVVGAVRDRIDLGWPIIAKRVRTIPAYGAMLTEAYDLTDPSEASIVHIAEALAAFMSTAFRATDTPFDRHLRGEAPLTGAALRGMELFYGEANCAACHSGSLLSDQGFHAIGVPGFGPGRTRRFDPIPRDVGRMGESDLTEDAYRFRTPMLRNVALTGPWGHNGAWSTLDGIVHQHLDPVGAHDAWTPADAKLPDVPWLAAVDFAIRSDVREMARQRAAIDIVPVDLADDQIDDLVAFLNALTDPSAARLPGLKPAAVPSGLPVD